MITWKKHLILTVNDAIKGIIKQFYGVANQTQTVFDVFI